MAKISDTLTGKFRARYYCGGCKIADEEIDWTEAHDPDLPDVQGAEYVVINHPALPFAARMDLGPLGEHEVLKLRMITPEDVPDEAAS